MKKHIVPEFIFFALCILISCNNEQVFPTYSLVVIQHVPDSLKEKQRIFITETVRAATQHLSTADYEDVDETINEAHETADELFSIPVTGLRVVYGGRFDQDANILPENMSPTEKRIFENLKKGIEP